MASQTVQRRDRWDGARVRALRSYLRLSQRELAQEMGVRQQTVSEWETGLYAPRGASARLLGIVAERAGFVYRVQGARPPGASHLAEASAD